MAEGSKHHGEQMPEERVEFGNTRSVWTRLSELNELEQTRQEYNDEAIRELAQSMVYVDENGQRQYELINDIVVGEFDDVQLASYIEEHEAYYGTEVDVEGLQPSEDGLWRIVLAGHRRRRAIEENCRQAGIAFTDAYVASATKPGISFEEALVLQLRENVHLRPPVIDEARQIDRYYRLRLSREGRAPSIASCARVLGFSETKISEALRYARLPQEVQYEVAAGALSYGHAVELHAYMGALQRYYPRRYADAYADFSRGRNLDQDVTAGLMTLVAKLKSEQLRGASARRKSEIIKATIATTNEAAAYRDGELFILEEDATPERRRRSAERMLGMQALTIALQRVRSADVSEEERRLLGQLQAEAAEADHQRFAEVLQDTLPAFNERTA